VVKILKGAKAGDLPVEQATKFEFVVNLKIPNTLTVASGLGPGIEPSSDRFPQSLRGTSKAPGTVFLLVLSPACVPTGPMW
jgi:hypothetical protein